MTNNKTYIGDGVYVDYDGYYVVLSTEDGYNETNRIYMTQSELNNFKLFLKGVGLEL